MLYYILTVGQKSRDQETSVYLFQGARNEFDIRSGARAGEYTDGEEGSNKPRERQVGRWADEAAGRYTLLLRGRCDGSQVYLSAWDCYTLPNEERAAPDVGEKGLRSNES